MIPTPVAVAVYLAAIVVANVLAATFGPSVVVLNAFALIGLDLTLRDELHERSRPMMAGVVLAGSALSYVFAPTVAIASAVAFLAASATDALVYEVGRRRGWPRTRRVMTSNVFAAAVDSVVFPTLAFGGLLPLTVAGLFVAKVAGSAAWLVILRAVARRRLPWWEREGLEEWEVEYQTEPDSEVDQ